VNRRIFLLYAFVVALGFAFPSIQPAVADTPAPKASADIATPIKPAGEPAADSPKEDAAAIAADKRLAETTGYLASPPLEGRGLGTHGLEMAGDYIAQRFKDLGLKTNLYDG